MSSDNELLSNCPNYLAVGKALSVLPSALRCHVERKMRDFQNKLIKKLGKTPCSCTKGKHSCLWATEIRNYNNSKIRHSQWQQNDSSKWIDPENGYWELAKLFTTSNQESVDKTDLSCLLGIMTYCKHFNVDKSLLKSVKDWRNKWAHSSTHKLTEDEKDKAFDAIYKLLGDSELSTSEEVQNCRTDIHHVQVKKDVSREEIYDILKGIEKKVSLRPSKKFTEFEKHDDPCEESKLYFVLQLFCKILFCFPANLLSLLAFSKWKIAFIILFMLPLSGDEVSRTTSNSCPRAREKSPLRHLKLREFNFSTYLVYKGEEFFGRRWFFSELEEMFNSTYPGVLITAEPGSGKTAFMSRLVCSPFSSFIHGYIIGYHFCDHALEARRDGSRFVRNLVDQIAGKLPEYQKRLSEDEDMVNYLKSTCHQDPVECFFRYIIEPLRDINKPCGERYILVDALDECVAKDSKTSHILDMLSKKISYFPEWLKLILTSRALATITTVIPRTVKRIPFDSTDERNVEDIRLYVKKFFSKNEELQSLTPNVDTLTDELVNKSEGNFLVAKTTLQYLNASRDQINVGKFPTTLYDAYSLFFQRHFSDNNPFTSYKPLFEILLATKSSLRKKEIQVILNRNAEQISQLIKNISPFLRFGDNETVALYHQSLVEWLNLQSDDFAICKSQGHRSIADFLLSNNGTEINASLKKLSELCLHIIQGGNIKSHVEALLQFGSFSEARHPTTGRCILHVLAVENNASDVLTIILEKFENVDIPDLDGRTPAFYAAAEGRSDNLKLFIERGASINDVHRNSLSNDSMKVLFQNKGAEYVSMMHIAAFRGHTEVIKMLLDNNCNYPKRKKIPSPLQLAAGRGHLEVVMSLYSQEDMKERHISLHHAAARNHSSIVKFLLDVGVADHCLPCKSENIPFSIENATVQNLHLSFCETALFAAVSRGYFEVASMLLENGPTAIQCKHRSGKTPLMSAVERNDTRLVKLLINRGADVNEDCGDKKSTLLNDMLCQHYPSNNRGRHLYTLYCHNDNCPCGNTAAHFAALQGLANVGVLLLQREHSSFFLKNCHGTEALRTAVSFDQANFLQNLRNTRLIEMDNSKMLYFAALCGSINVLKLFNNSLYKPVKGTQTLLHQVVKWSPHPTHEKSSFCTKDFRRDLHKIDEESKKRISFMKFILESQRSETLFVNKKDENGRTALHLAAHGGFVEAVEYLVESGAEINIKDKKGLSPLDLAIMNTPANASGWHELNGGNFSEYNTTCFDKTAAYLISQKGSQIKDCDSRTSKLLQSVITKIIPLSFESLLKIGVDMKCSVDAEYNPVLFHLQIGGPVIREIIKMYEYDVFVQCDTPFRTSELHLMSYSADSEQVGNFFQPSLNNKRFPLQRLLEKNPKSFFIFDECRDAEGFLAIHRAAQGANIHAVKWFIKVGANAFLQSTSGLTSLDMSILYLGQGHNSKTFYSILNKSVPLNSQKYRTKVFHELLFHFLQSEKYKSMLQCKNQGVDELSPLHFAALAGEKTLKFVYHQASSTSKRLPKKCANKHWIHPNYLAHFYDHIHKARQSPVEKQSNTICYEDLKAFHQFPDREAELHIIYNHFFKSPTELENSFFFDSLTHFENFDVAECPGFYDYLPWRRNYCQHEVKICVDEVNRETSSAGTCQRSCSNICPRSTSLDLYRPRDVCTYQQREVEIRYFMEYHCHYIMYALQQWFTREPRNNRQMTDFIAKRMEWTDPPKETNVLFRWPFYFLYKKLKNEYKEYEYLKALNSALEIYHEDYGS